MIKKKRMVKKVKMIKKKKPIQSVPKEKEIPNITYLRHNWGGHMPFPPEGCERIEFAFNHEGVTWLDLNICHPCSLLKTCQRRKEYLKSLKR